jgi:hypothetical protein
MNSLTYYLTYFWKNFHEMLFLRSANVVRHDRNDNQTQFY